ncbi:MAG: hypothetical protein OEQ12_03100 [Nitrosopumilus sp.]|nr:hypothetical protein [Nitrosopumilus sp.]
MTLNYTQRILAGAIALAILAGMTSPAFANPIGDTVIIFIEGIPTDPQNIELEVIFGTEQLFDVFNDSQDFIVDIEENSVFIGYPANLFGLEMHSVHIEDIDWLDENGNEVQGNIEDMFCEAFEDFGLIGPVQSSFSNGPNGSEIWIEVDPSIFLTTSPASIQCQYTVEHVEPEDQQVAGKLLPLDSTTLLIGGISSVSVWMIPTVGSIAGAGIYLVKYRTNKE